MRKLIRADLMRLKKDKVFWGGCILLMLYCGVMCIIQYRTMRELDTQIFLDNFLFGSFELIGIVLAVFISLFVGTEYSDGTIRNKIVAGCGRTDIYMANTAACMIGAAVSILAAMLFTVLLGIPLFGFFYNPLPRLLLLLVVYFAAAAAYASIFNLTAMLIPNKAYAAVVNILLAFALLFLAIYLYARLSAEETVLMADLVNGEIRYSYEANPSYLTGRKRELYQFFFDFLPGGQAMQVACLEAAHPGWMLVYSVVITVVTNVVGVFFFRKKDIR